MTESPIDWDESYKEWLSSGVTNSRLIETLEVAHTAFAQPLWLVNGEQVESLPLADQGGVLQEFLPSRMLVEPTPVGESTEQQTQVTISSLEGALYSELKKMTMAERSDPMTITIRQYLSGDKTTQLINPPPVWYVHSVALSQSVVRANLRISPLRVHRIGRYYTALEFPSLRISK